MSPLKQQLQQLQQQQTQQSGDASTLRGASSETAFKSGQGSSLRFRQDGSWDKAQIGVALRPWSSPVGVAPQTARNSSNRSQFRSPMLPQRDLPPAVGAQNFQAKSPPVMRREQTW